MLSSLHIAVDASGGDFGSHLPVRAAVQFLQDHPSVSLTLFGPLADLHAQAPDPVPRLFFQDAPESVAMGDKPSSALRSGRQSSMALAVQMVADGQAQACISAGNTGAFMAFGKHHLGTLPGIERPAICKAVPTAQGVCYVLDLGANLECSARNLCQFAQMGTAVAQVAGVSEPRVGVLNVGHEAHKGRVVQQEAARLLEADPRLNFCGFVEAGDVYTGVVDVVVCDGFAGNVLLKASEGTARLIQEQLKRSFQSHFWYRGLYRLVRPVLRHWQQACDPNRYNGAVLLGLQGVAVKSHGNTSLEGFCAALQVAYEQARLGAPERIAKAIKQIQPL